MASSLRPLELHDALVASTGRLSDAPDARLTLSWGNTAQRFAVAYRTNGSPKTVDAAAQDLLRYCRSEPQTLPLIVAPYLRDEIMQELVQQGISALDLSGNVLVIRPESWFVYRTGAPNQYPASTRIKNVYRGRSSMVARALMLNGEFPSATALLKALTSVGELSMPTVSKVLKALEDELIVDRSDVIRVIQPDRLLENLTANYRDPQITMRVTGKLDLSPKTIERFDRNESSGACIHAFESVDAYTVLPSVHKLRRIFTTSISELTKHVPIDTDARFPNIELVETPDYSMFVGRVHGEDGYRLSPLECYLLLMKGEKREQQAAAQMRQNLLEFQYR